MNARVFLDTNVLVYAFDSSDAAKHKRSLQLLKKAGAEGGHVISTLTVRNPFD